MEKHTIVHIKKDCISCGACAAIAPDYWEMDEQALAKLKGAVQKGENWEIDINTEEAKAINQEAADVCPVNIIHIKKKE